MSILSKSRQEDLRQQIQKRVKGRPTNILAEMLKSGGVSSRKFRQLCRDRSWRETAWIASFICSVEAVLIVADGSVVSASCGVYESGGCSSYLKLQDFLSEGNGWKRMTLPRAAPTVVQLIERVSKLKETGRPLKLTRHWRSKFGREKVPGLDITASELFRKLGDLAACK